MKLGRGKFLGPGLDRKILVLIGLALLLGLARSELTRAQEHKLDTVEKAHFQELCLGLDLKPVMVEGLDPGDWCGDGEVLLYRNTSETLGSNGIAVTMPLLWGEEIILGASLGGDRYLWGTNQDKQLLQAHLDQCPAEDRLLTRLPEPNLIPLSLTSPKTLFGQATRLLWGDRAFKLALRILMGAQTPLSQAQIILRDLKEAADQLNCAQAAVPSPAQTNPSNRPP